MIIEVLGMFGLAGSGVNRSNVLSNDGIAEVIHQKQD